MTEQYKIIEAQLPLVGGIGGHNFIVLIDPSGKVIGEINGLATGSEGGIKPIGYLPSDSLKVYSTGEAYFYKTTRSQGVLYSGSQSEVMNKWNAALDCSNAINDRDLPYPFFGLGANSNSVASTLVQCMNLKELPLSGGALLTPGAGSILLDQSTINIIQNNYGITPSAVSRSQIISSEQVRKNLDGSITTTTNFQDGSKDVEIGTDGELRETAYASSGLAVASSTVSTTQDGTLNVSIVGVGASLNLNNASINLADGANATVMGSGNTVNVSGSLATLYEAGSGNTLNISGVSDNTTVTGTGTTANVSGWKDSTSIQGLGDITRVTGNGDNNTVVSGISDVTTVTGSWNRTWVTGWKDSTVIQGQGDVTNVSGSGDNNTTVSGIGDSTAVDGNWNQTLITGWKDNTYIQGQGDTTTVTGNGDNNTTVSGISDSTTVTGSWNQTLISGWQDSTSVQGQGDVTLVTGSGDDNTTVSGIGDITTVTGSWNQTLITGWRGTSFIQGQGDVTVVTGSGDDNTTVSGIGDITTVTGSWNQTVITGWHDTSYILGQGDLTSAYGNGDDTFTGAGWSHTNDVGNPGTPPDPAYVSPPFVPELQPAYVPPPPPMVEPLPFPLPPFDTPYIPSYCIGVDPVILNLQGGKVDTQGLTQSSAYFDMQNDGQKVHTGWATAGEGMLVHDKNHTGVVSSDADLVAGFSVLQGLDDNHDAKLDTSDSAWQDLKVWVDTDGSGNFRSADLYTMDQLGITSINLNATHVNQDSYANTVLDESTFNYADGRTGDIAGVNLMFNPYDTSRQLPGSPAGAAVQNSVNQLIQAMSSFAPPAAGFTSSLVASSLALQTPMLVMPH